MPLTPEEQAENGDSAFGGLGNVTVKLEGHLPLRIVMKMDVGGKFVAWEPSDECGCLDDVFFHLKMLGYRDVSSQLHSNEFGIRVFSVLGDEELKGKGIG